MAEDKWADLDSRFGPKDEVTVTPKGRDYAIRTILAEGGDQGPMGMAAIGHVIGNRVRHGGFGEGLEGVIMKPYAFEPWLHAGKGKGNDPLRYDPASPQYQTAGKIFDAVMSGQIPDPTRGATHFYSPSGQAQLASIDNRKLVPDWATGEAHRATIGGHEFYAPEGAGAGKKIITISRPGEGEYQLPDYLRQAEETSGGYLLPSQRPVIAPPQQAPLKNIELNLPQGGMAPQAPVAAPAWGPVSSALTGGVSALTGGLGEYPKAAATVRAGYEALTGQAPSGFGARRQELARQFQQEREAYQAEHPMANLLAEQGGALVGAAAPMAAAGRGLKAGVEVVKRLAPEVAPALEAAGRFVAGKTAATAPGPMAAIPRAASYATQGALQGAGYGALTRGLQPEGTTLPEAIGTGAMGGAIGASVVNPFIGALAAPLAAEIAPPLRALAQNVNQKFGLNIRPTQIARNPEILALDERVIPAHIRDAQVVKFNEHLADQIGMRGKELTKQNVEQAMRKEGQALSDIAANTSMVPTRNFFQELGKIRGDVYATTLPGNPLRAKVDQILMKIYNESATGAMGGNKFRAFTKKDGLLDKELLNSGDPSFRQAGYELKAKMFDMFHVSDPKQAVAYDRSRNNYRKLLAIEPLTGNSGIVDPTKVLKRAQKYNLTGDVQELAEAGRYLPKTTSTGGIKPAAKEAGWQQAFEAAKQIGPLGVPAGVAQYFGIAPDVTGAAMTVLGGGQYVGSKLRNWAMASPLVGRMALAGRLPDVATPLENILARGAAGEATQVGAGKGR
jgi:hypothetical protein